LRTFTYVRHAGTAAGGGSVFALTDRTEPKMDRIFTLAATAAALTVVAIVLVFGPVVAAFVVAGSSFVLMIGLIAFSGVHAVEQWWRGHPSMLHRTKTH